MELNSGRACMNDTCNEVLLKPELHSTSIDGSRNKEEACLGAEDSKWWRKALAHATFWTWLSPASRCQQQQKEPQPFHYPPQGTGQLQDRKKMKKYLKAKKKVDLLQRRVLGKGKVKQVKHCMSLFFPFLFWF